MHSCSNWCIFQPDDVEFVCIAVIFGVYFSEMT